MTTKAGRTDLGHLVRIAHVPDEEPVFYLRARDPAAASAIRAWAQVAHFLGVDTAVVEQALIQADAFDGYPHKRLPDLGDTPEGEAKQLRYQHGRRAWRARGDARLDPEALILAERRGWDAAMAAVRAGAGDVAA